MVSKLEKSTSVESPTQEKDHSKCSINGIFYFKLRLAIEGISHGEEIK